ncbi:hypothetical protein [Halioxenophilus sp. WMMB6]|nr:hypothetical protein [Halioxenophilus sp. WMMB6]
MLTPTLRLTPDSLTKIGYAGLIFFTIKGLLWLLVPIAIATWF